MPTLTFTCDGASSDNTLNGALEMSKYDDVEATVTERNNDGNIAEIEITAPTKALAVSLGKIVGGELKD